MMEQQDSPLIGLSDRAAIALYKALQAAIENRNESEEQAWNLKEQ